MTGPRDWDKEMAEIDKVIASGKAPAPGSPSAAVQPRSSAPAVASHGGAVMTRKRDTLAVWARTLVGVGGAVALRFWPYGKSCGTMLYLYMAATVVLSLVGVWTMRSAWTHRRGVAHVAGLLVLFAGISYAALEVLQRTAYAAVRLGWTCP